MVVPVVTGRALTVSVPVKLGLTHGPVVVIV